MLEQIGKISRILVVSRRRIALFALLAVAASIGTPATAQSGSSLYTNFCYGCHRTPGSIEDEDNVLSAQDAETLSAALDVQLERP